MSACQPFSGCPLIADPRNLSGVARILVVEGYHAGTIQTQLYVNGFYNQAQAITSARARAQRAESRPQTRPRDR
jgi:hypothetical protein